MAWDMWLDCHSERAIGDILGVSHETAGKYVAKFGKSAKISQPPGATADSPWGNVQHFDIWDFPRPEGDSSYRALQPTEREAARERITEGARAGAAITNGQERPTESFGKADRHANETTAKIGSFAGVSGRTVEKIAKVVDAAKAEPERFGPLVQEMDKTGKVDGVYKRVIAEQKNDEIEAERAEKLAAIQHAESLVVQITRLSPLIASRLRGLAPRHKPLLCL
ncbi:MAG TPA: hypothetical protein VG651_20395 [Stellaceae bacterium]|nr:hypothetical protein [Stellaceae bacterium]